MRRMPVKTILSVAVGAAVVCLAPPSQMVFGASPTSQHGPIAWSSSLSEAKIKSARTHRPIFVDFYADWCGPCQEMLHTTYQNKQVVERSKDFIPVLINVDKQPDLAKKYGVTAIPTVAFLDANGKVLKQSVGYRDAPAFLSEAGSVLKLYRHG